MAIVLPDPEYVLRGVAGTVFGRTYHLLAPTVIGRAPECDICVDAPGLSRKHARLRPTLDGVVIEDLNSTNGSFLNGQRLTSGIARVGDEIAFDQLRFRLADVPKPQAAAHTQRVSLHSRSRGHWRWTLVGVLAIGAVVALVAWQRSAS